MFNSHRLLDLPVIALNNGNQVGTVKKLVIDPDKKALVALVITEHRNLARTQIIPFEQVKGVGAFAVTTTSDKAVIPAKNSPQVLDLLKKQISMRGRRVVSENGQLLGTIEKLFIDAETGQLAALELSGPLLKSMVKGRCLLAGQFIKTIGESTVVAAAKAEKHLQTVPTKLHKTWNKVKSGSTQTDLTHEII